MGVNGDVRATLEKCKEFAATYPCACDYRYPGSTAYHGHDCENEVVQEFVAQFVAQFEAK